MPPSVSPVLPQKTGSVQSSVQKLIALCVLILDLRNVLSEKYFCAQEAHCPFEPWQYLMLPRVKFVLLSEEEYFSWPINSQFQLNSTQDAMN